MVFHRSLSDSKSLLVSGTLLSILVDLNNVVIGMVSILPLISNSSTPFTNPLENIPSAPITIGITVTLMFHSFLSSLAKSKYKFFFSLSFILISGSPERQSPLDDKFFFLVNQ